MLKDMSVPGHRHSASDIVRGTLSPARLPNTVASQADLDDLSELVADLETDKADVVHTHDDRYYTETETDALLADKADSTHLHDDRYVRTVNSVGPDGSGNVEVTAGGIAPVVDIFTSSGTWTKPDGCTRVRVRLVGGGGAGGPVTGGSGQGQSGSGGGGGYVEHWFDADDLGPTESVTIGAGGVGTTSSASGGGQSSFATLTANGGGAGGAGTATTGDGVAAGGLGGTASGGDIIVRGGAGSAARVLAGKAVLVGGAGASPLGSSARFPTVAGPGVDGEGYGAGGTGAFTTTNTFAGGNGSPGVCIIESF